MVPPSKEALAASALAAYRDQHFATLLTVMIGLAAERHPEELRAALAKVFDVSGIEECTRRTMNVLADVQRRALDARQAIGVLEERLQAWERRVENHKSRTAG